MQSSFIIYIIFKLGIPLFLLLFSTLVFLYLRKWILIWNLSYTQNKITLKTYKLLMLLFIIPILAYNVIQIQAFALKTTDYFASFPVWLKMTYIYPSYIWHLTIVPLFLLILLLSILKIISFPIQLIYKITKKKKIPVSPMPSLSKRNYLKKMAIAIPASVLSINTVGVFSSEYEYKIETIFIKDEKLSGLTATHISDIHFGSFMGEEKLMFFIDKINKLKSDFIFITGDIIDNDPALIPLITKCLGSLNTVGGAYACLGNHEYYAGVHDSLQSYLGKIGINLLVNESADIVHKGLNFYIMGLDYPYIDKDDRFNNKINNTKLFINKALENTKDDKPKILLSHHPNTFAETQKHNISLTLSGHTHGGQIIFGKWNKQYITPIQFAFPYLKGHYTANTKHLYVNSGLGHWLPLRINCPVEITQIIFT